VRGSLFTDDLAAAQQRHDQLAAGGESAAKQAGDFGHDALLGTSLLGTEPDRFLGFDRWRDAGAMSAFYENPEFAQAFGALFAAPPSVERFVRADDWHGWGDPTSGDAHDPHWFVVVRGRLAGDDAQPSHDTLAAGGEQPAKDAGDVAHAVYLGLDDAREFLAIDVWKSDAAIEGFYGNPDFQAAFGALFEAPPSVGVYRSTDWHQW
jgi:quinol monooxygenase YgiN